MCIRDRLRPTDGEIFVASLSENTERGQWTKVQYTHGADVHLVLGDKLAWEEVMFRFRAPLVAAASKAHMTRG